VVAGTGGTAGAGAVAAAVQTHRRNRGAAAEEETPPAAKAAWCIRQRNDSALISHNPPQAMNALDKI